MGSITNFKPIRDKKAGLRDDITFTFTDMGELTPVEFRAQSDLEVQEAIANEQTLFLNVSPDGLVQLALPGDIGNLREATQQEKIDEYQRVAAIRAQVRAAPSSFVSIQYQVGDGYQQVVVGSPESVVRTQRATKGDILDVAREFKERIRTTDPTTFTNFVIGNTQSFQKVINIRETNLVEIENVAAFNKDEYVTFFSPQYFLNKSATNRDVMLFKVEEVVPEQVETVTSNEIQTLQFLNADPTLGTFELTQTQTTFDIDAYDVDATQASLMQQRLNEDIVGLSEVSISGTFAAGFDFLFEGSDGKFNHKQLIASSRVKSTKTFTVGSEIVLSTVQEGSGSLDEIQKIEFFELPDSGTFSVQYKGTVASPLPSEELPANLATFPVNVSASAMQTGLRALPGLTDVEVTRTDSSSVTIAVDTTQQGKAPVNELQRLTFSDLFTQGSYKLRYQEEAAFTASDTASTIESGLNALRSLSTVTASGDFVSDIVVSFQGADAGFDHQNLATISNLTITNALTGSDITISAAVEGSGSTDEVQEINFLTIPDAGTFTITYNGTPSTPVTETTSTLTFNAVGSEVQAALRALPSLSDVNVTKSSPTAVAVTTERVQQGIVPKNEIQRITFSEDPTDGSFTLTYLETTDDIDFDTESAMRAATALALNNLRSLSQVEVNTGTFGSGFTIEFKNADGLFDHKALIPNSNLTRTIIITDAQVTVSQEGSPTTDEIQVIQFPTQPTGGTFTVTHGAQTTGALPFNTLAAQLQTALRNLSSLSDVVVSGSVAVNLTVSFVGADGLTDQPTLVLDTTQLTRTDPVALTITTPVQGGASDEEQLLSFSDTPTEGSFTLTYEEDALFTSGVTASTLASGLSALRGVASVETREILDGYEIEFLADGYFNHRQLDAYDTLLETKVDMQIIPTTIQNGSASQLEIQRIRFITDPAEPSAIPTEGSFTLRYKTAETGSILYTAISSDVESALQAESGTEADLAFVTVTGTFQDGFTLRFGAPVGNTNLEQTIAGSNTLRRSRGVNVNMLTLQEGDSTQVDRIERLRFNQTPSAGSFRLQIGTGITEAFSSSVTSGDLQTGINNLTNYSGATVVNGPEANSFDITFGNAFTTDGYVAASVPVNNTLSTALKYTVTFAGLDGLKDHDLLTVTPSLTKTDPILISVSSDEADPENQTLEFINANGTGTIAGTFSLVYQEDTVAITDNDQIASALSSLRGVADVNVTQDNLIYDIEFQNDGYHNHSLLQVVENTLAKVNAVVGSATTIQTGSGSQNERQQVGFSPSPTEGTFTLTFNGETTGEIAFDATAGVIGSELELLSTVNSVAVTSRTLSGFVVEFTGADGLQNQPDMIVSVNSLQSATSITTTLGTVANGDSIEQDEIQTLVFSEAADSGSFTLTFKGERTSTLIPFSADKTAIEAALEGLSTVTDVLVQDLSLPAPEVGFSVTFQNADGSTNQPLIEVGDNTLRTVLQYEILFTGADGLVNQEEMTLVSNLTRTTPVGMIFSTTTEGDEFTDEEQKLFFTDATGLEVVSPSGTVTLSGDFSLSYITSTGEMEPTLSSLEAGLLRLRNVSGVNLTGSFKEINGSREVQVEFVDPSEFNVSPLTLAANSLQGLVGGQPVNVGVIILTTIDGGKQKPKQELINGELVNVTIPAHIKVRRTARYPLFTEAERFLDGAGEQTLENRLSDFANKPMYVISGIPVLVNASSLDTGNQSTRSLAPSSLLDTEVLINGRAASGEQGEIPFTRLYVPISEQDEGDFIGNLNKKSVSVTLHENDQEIALVEKGEAVPEAGVSVDYFLVNQKNNQSADNVKFGDVNVRIRLAAPKARLPIVGLSQKGTNAVKVGVRLATTPDQIDSEASAGTEPGEGEFYFNFQLVQKKTVDRTEALTETLGQIAGTELTADVNLQESNLPIVNIKAIESIQVTLPPNDLPGTIRKIVNVSEDGSTLTIAATKILSFSATDITISSRLENPTIRDEDSLTVDETALLHPIFSTLEEGSESLITISRLISGFGSGDQVRIFNSNGNDDTYNIISVSFNLQQTIVRVSSLGENGGTLTSGGASGAVQFIAAPTHTITIPSHGLRVGQSAVLTSSTGQLPLGAPNPAFIIVVDNNRIRLAESAFLAEVGESASISTTGAEGLSAAQIPEYTLTLDTILEVGKIVSANFIKTESGPWVETENEPGLTGEIVNTVNLNKYGAIRIFDRVKIIINDGTGERILRAVVKNIDTKRSLIVLDSPLSTNIPAGSTIEIPQSPFNPGQTYKVSISAEDRSEG